MQSHEAGAERAGRRPRGGVWKKRLNDNKDRSIIVAKGERYWIHADLVSKQDKVTIDEAELGLFRTLAAS